MKRSISRTGCRASSFAAIALGLWIAGSAIPAMAQFGGGRGPTLAPEKQDAAWSLEARSVAQELKLSDDAAKKMTETYKAARKTFQEAVQKLMADAAGDRMAMMQGMMETRETEIGKLETALKGNLEEAQLKTAMASLGSFNPQWDMMVDTLAEFKLDDKKFGDALKLTKTYIEGANKAQSDAMASMDFQSLREETQKLREKLDGDLTPILSADQLAQWKSKTTPQRRQRGGGVPGGAGDAAPPAAPGGANPPPKSEK